VRQKRSARTNMRPARA